MFHVEVPGCIEWRRVHSAEGLPEAERWARSIGGRWRIVRWNGGLSWTTVRES
jgi:hypothetical protein